MGVSSPEQVQWAFEQAKQHSRSVIVEQNFLGHDHRFLVINGEVIAVARRDPAHVIGDGRRSIAELISEANSDPLRGDGHETFLTRIQINETLINFLARSGRTLESIPAHLEPVQLTPTANLSTGGTAVDLTDETHPDNLMVARRAALAIGLDIAGIDFISPDITKSVFETGGGIIEVNAAPGFRMHLQPSVGRARNVAKPVLDMLFPKGKETQVPIFAITGTNGKSTTVRMLAQILQRSGLTVGFTTSTGIYINGQRIVKADASGPKSARLILKDPTVEAAVFETARGGILREGLGFDSCDVGAVLNVSEDHLGLKGIDTVEDLAAVKSVVVESVKSDGFSVLNADDPLTADMDLHAGGRIAFFSSVSEDERPGFLSHHIAEGGVAIVLEPSPKGAGIVVHDDGHSMFVMPAADIPATFGGMADFNVENALAAVAMSYVHGIPISTIRAALSEFTTSYEQSPGRLNVCDVHGFRVIIDYAHNPHGLRALGRLVDRFRPDYRRTIGVISMAGDRRDDDMRQMGRLAAQIFDRIIVREDEDLRGRAPGEICALLKEGAVSGGMAQTHIQCVLPESESIDTALKLAGPNDLVVLAVDNYESAWRQVTSFQPAPDDPAGKEEPESWASQTKMPDGSMAAVNTIASQIDPNIRRAS